MDPPTLPPSSEAGAETTKTGVDGTIYDYNPVARAWLPRVDESVILAYQANYGGPPVEDSEPPMQPSRAPPLPQSDASASGSSAKASRKRKRKEESTVGEDGMVHIGDSVNPHVYVTGLPADVTVEELAAFMGRCGILRKVDDSEEPRIKIYRDANGLAKGDALCTYFKVDSVPLAFQILDGTDLRPNCPITLQRATFKPKTEKDKANDQERKRKKGKGKKVAAEAALLSWNDDTDNTEQVRNKRMASTIILKNMFVPSEFDEDPTYLVELREDIEAECAAKAGEVGKVQIFDRHPDGVILVRFKALESVPKCLEVFNGRWFAKRRISAEKWDGTSYKVEESEEEARQRRDQWEQYLLGGGGDKKEE